MFNQKPKILVVDDEPELRSMLSIFLEVEEFDVIESATGAQAVRAAITEKPDLVLLDLGLADGDGKNIISALQRGGRLPIIVLTARTADEEVALALNLGVDDYVTKPFHADVLLARIKANIRSSGAKHQAKPHLTNGPIKIDLDRHEVFVGDTLVPFSPKEFDLLKFFMTHIDRSLTQRELLAEVWGPGHTDNTQYLRVYIGQLRAKLKIVADLGAAIVAERRAYRMNRLPDSKRMLDYVPVTFAGTIEPHGGRRKLC